ncbi:MAG: tetratricopeptide repeat protein [Gammaproteobacteria bacterium]|nr:tetratricopeptide repeat protein [Gammaproteobacteria bacterium]
MRLLPALLLAVVLAGCMTAGREGVGSEPAGPEAGTLKPASALAPDASPGAADPVAASETESRDAAVPAPEAVAAVTLAAFPKDTLYDLLVAELALRQGDLATALESYVTQARLTRDPGVVAQAVRLTVLSRDIQRGLEMAELWASLAPKDPRARQAAGLALIRVDDLKGALSHFAELRAQSGSANFGYLASQAGHLDPEARADLAQALAALQLRFPDDAQLAYAQALLMEQLRRPEQALAVLAGHPLDELPREALLLQSQLLAGLGRRDEAIAILDERLGDGMLQDGEEARLRYARARLLIDAGRFGAAREDFEALLARVGDNAEILLSLSLLALEQDEIAAARSYLERLLATGRRRDVAHYYLGELARTQGDVEAAVAAFGQVMPGAEFRSAQLRASALLLQHTGSDGLGDYLALQRARYPGEAVALWLLESGLLLEVAAEEEALEVLDAAIEAHPDDLELRYARALARKRVDDIAGLEADLRHILELDPDHAMALNALGYILADRTDRYGEAKALITRALELRPNEPAYIDSLGWVEYRLGNHARARTLLERAYRLMPDHEIAAHLGEVLWVMGKREAALQTWEEGLALDPDSDVLAETMERLLGSERALGVRSGVGRAR